MLDLVIFTMVFATSIVVFVIFIHSIVVHRRDEAIRGVRNWIREDPLVHPYKWLRPDLIPPAPFLQCEPHLSSVFKHWAQVTVWTSP